jgi:hypothetical protein
MKKLLATLLITAVACPSFAAPLREQPRVRTPIEALVDHFYAVEISKLAEISSALLAGEGEGTAVEDKILSEQDQAELGKTTERIAKLRTVADGNQPKLDELEKEIALIVETNYKMIVSTNADRQSVVPKSADIAYEQSLPVTLRRRLDETYFQWAYRVSPQVSPEVHEYLTLAMDAERQLAGPYENYMIASKCAALNTHFSAKDLKDIATSLKATTAASILTPDYRDWLWRALEQKVKQRNRIYQEDCNNAAIFFRPILAKNIENNTSANPFQ